MDTGILTLSTVVFLFQGSGLDIFTILDKYGFPTAVLAVAILFIWNRQKRSDADAAAQRQETNDLIRKLLEQKECKFTGERPGINL
jgi:hypothetical protein